MSDHESCIPEFDAMALLQQRLASKGASSPSGQSSTGKATVDPYQLMVQRRAQNAGAADYPIQSWPEEDIKKLEDFCREHGILGFNAGNMNPLSALAFLKQKLGIIENPTKSESYGPNYPYTEAMQKRRVLHG